MREDEDHLRQYLPVLRRIVILAAVLTAVPVVMWVVTAFVSMYVGPPKLPTFQRATVATTRATPTEETTAAANATALAAPEQPTAAPPPVITEDTDAGTDATGTVPSGDQNGVAPSDDAAKAATGSQSAGAPADAAPAAAETANDATPAEQVPSATNPTPVGEPQSVGQQRPGAATSPLLPANEQPATAPLTPPVVDASTAAQVAIGTVPLPRRRPRPETLAVAQAGIPLPQSRPDAAGPPAAESTPETTATPLGWLRKIFQPSSSTNTAPAAEGGSTPVSGDVDR